MRYTTMKYMAFVAFGLQFAASAIAAEVRYYPVPKGSHPHDVALAADSSVWYTGQSGYCGSVNPGSGEVRVWPVPKGSGPYGIAATPSGDIYYVSLADFVSRIVMATMHPPAQRSKAAVRLG